MALTQEQIDGFWITLGDEERGLLLGVFAEELASTGDFHRKGREMRAFMIRGQALLQKARDFTDAQIKELQDKITELTEKLNVHDTGTSRPSVAQAGSPRPNGGANQMPAGNSGVAPAADAPRAGGQAGPGRVYNRAAPANPASQGVRKA